MKIKNRAALLASLLILLSQCGIKAADAQLSMRGAGRAEALRAHAEAVLMQKFDVNKNGKLDPDEEAAWQKAQAKRKNPTLFKYDKNGDGKLDATERAALHAAWQALVQEKSQQARNQEQ